MSVCMREVGGERERQASNQEDAPFYHARNTQVQVYALPVRLPCMCMSVYLYIYIFTLTVVRENA